MSTESSVQTHHKCASNSDNQRVQKRVYRREITRKEIRVLECVLLLNIFFLRSFCGYATFVSINIDKQLLLFSISTGRIYDKMY